MSENNEFDETVPTIRIRATGDARVITFNVPIRAVLRVDGIEVV